MRHIISFITLFAAVMASAAPSARWLAKEHNFGAFDENLGVVTCQFKAVNDGDEPLVVMSARANCGCTRPDYSSAPVAPGDTLVINVGYDPEGRPGRFTKHVKVVTNAGNAEFTIRGTVIATSNTIRNRFPIDLGPVKMREKVFAFGEMIKGKSVGGYIEGYNQSSDTIAPRAVGVPPFMSVLIEPARVAPGEQFVVTGVLHSGKVRGWGIVTDGFTLIPDVGAADSLAVDVVMILKEDFGELTPEVIAKAPVVTLSAEKVELPDVTPGKESATTFTITNAGKSTLEIRDLKSIDNALVITPKATKIKPGKSTQVKVVVPASAIPASGVVNQRITVITNDPVNPNAYLRVVGAK